MTSNSLALLNQLRPVSVGFNDLFARFESMFDDGMSPTLNQRYISNYPPYNIVQVDKSNYEIQVALAGFTKDDISVTVTEGYVTVESTVPDSTDEPDQESRTLHKGISTRWFKRSFTIADTVEVTGATLADGMLTISLAKQLPEEPEVQIIDIK